MVGGSPALPIYIAIAVLSRAADLKGQCSVEYRQSQCIYPSVCTTDSVGLSVYPSVHPPICPEALSGRLNGGMTNVQADAQIPSVFYRALAPFGSAAQKVRKKWKVSLPITPTQ